MLIDSSPPGDEAELHPSSKDPIGRTGEGGYKTTQNRIRNGSRSSVSNKRVVRRKISKSEHGEV